MIMKVEGKVRVTVRLRPASTLHEMSIALSGEVNPVLRRIIITVAISYRF
jgi:hypothetical protein